MVRRRGARPCCGGCGPLEPWSRRSDGVAAGRRFTGEGTRCGEHPGVLARGRPAAKGAQVGVRVGRGTSPERGGPHRNGRNRPAGCGPKARLESVEKVLTRFDPGKNLSKLRSSGTVEHELIQSSVLASTSPGGPGHPHDVDDPHDEKSSPNSADDRQPRWFAREGDNSDEKQKSGEC